MRAAAAVAVILAPVAAALVELALAALLIAVLALEAFARTAALVVARRARLRGICAFRGNRRRVGAWPAMLVVTVAAMAAMTLALVIAGSRFTFGCGSGGFIRPLVAAAIMTRTALVRTSARPPDFDQDRFCRNRCPVRTAPT